MERRGSKERLSMNGFFVNIRVEGTYQIYSLADFTEKGIGVYVPHDAPFFEGNEYEIRFNLIDDDYEGFNKRRRSRTKNDAVSASGIIVRIQKVNDYVNLIGFEMDYIDRAEKKDIRTKVDKARVVVKKLMKNPRVHLEFGLQVEEAHADESLRGYPVYEGLFATEKLKIEFLINADDEHHFDKGWHVTVELPVVYKDHYIILSGYIESNEIYNMSHNIITIKVNLKDEQFLEYIKGDLKAHLEINNDVMRFKDSTRGKYKLY